MKKNLIKILLTFLLVSCFFSNYKSERIKSPSGKFEIQAFVNRTDKESDNFADVIIYLFDKNNNKLAKLNSGAGDGQKWAIGWTQTGDTIILQSCDIGNKAWVVQNEKPYEIKMTNKLDERAECLKREKYK